MPRGVSALGGVSWPGGRCLPRKECLVKILKH